MNVTYTDAMVRGVFPHEGGYTNHPSDPGGPTNWGITIHDARMYWKASATAEDVRSMPKEVAEDIYRKHYALPVRYNDLPAGVDYSVLDYAINSGVGRAGKVLRRLVGLPDNTSAITDEVIAAVLKREPVDLVHAINNERLAFLKRLNTWPVFGVGWERRVSEVRNLSLAFTKQQTAVLSNKPAAGKGHVPEPKAVKKVIVGAGGGGGAGIVAWTYKHPGLAGLAVVGVVVVIGGALYLVNQWHENQQHAATPGIQPVKEAA